MDESTRIQVYGLVAGIVASDHEVASEEVGLLGRIRKRFGLADNDALPQTINPDQAVEILKGLSDDVRKEAMRLLIQAAAADGKIVPEERAFLDAVAEKLEVSQVELERRIDRALAAPKVKPLGPDVALKDDGEDEE